jgi:hypothetical protein
MTRIGRSIENVNDLSNALTDELKHRMSIKFDYFYGREAWLYESQVFDLTQECRAAVAELSNHGFLTIKEYRDLQEWITDKDLETRRSLDRLKMG